MNKLKKKVHYRDNLYWNTQKKLSNECDSRKYAALAFLDLTADFDNRDLLKKCLKNHGNDSSTHLSFGGLSKWTLCLLWSQQKQIRTYDVNFGLI